MKHFGYFWDGLNGWVFCSVIATITFVSRWFSVDFPGYLWASAVLTASVIYNVDHAVDAYRAKKPQLLAARHKIYLEYPVLMLFWNMLVAMLLLLSLSELSLEIYYFGVAGISFIGIWYGLRYFLRKMPVHFWIKVFGISVGYVGGIWGALGAYAKIHYKDRFLPEEWLIPAIGYALLVLTNVLICNQTQLEHDAQYRFKKSIIHKRLPKYTNWISIIYWVILLNKNITASICAICICVGFEWLLRKSNNHTHLSEIQFADAFMSVPIVLQIELALSTYKIELY